MTTLKIVLRGCNKEVVLCGEGMRHLRDVEAYVLERFSSLLNSLKLDITKCRKYWIDEEGDCIEILNNADFQFFLKRAAKMYFEDQYPVRGENPKLRKEERESSDIVPCRETEYRMRNYGSQFANPDLSMKFDVLFEPNRVAFSFQMGMRLE